MIYLDHNATTPIAPEVAEAMAPYLYRKFGNPSSGYRLGQEAKEGVEAARGQVAGLLECSAEEVCFTSGGTESNNTVIKGVAHTLREKGTHIITTSIEHPAITNPALFLLNQGYDVTFVPVNGAGVVDPDDVKKSIKDTTILISVMHANNETGTIEPIAEIGKVARESGILFHTDAAQSVGKIGTNVAELNVDFLSLAGHKVYAPKGVGALYIRNGITVEPLIHGSGQERGRRAGTENVPFVVGLGAACALAKEEMEDDFVHIRRLRDRLHERLLFEIPNLVLNGHPDKRLPNTLNVSFPGIEGGALLELLSDVCASTGAACHDRSVKLSHVLAAMNVPVSVGKGAVRLSLGRENTNEEIDQAADAIIAAYKKLRG
ncbi:MAG: cysteine desulfurase family protein [Pseudomonadota bacterium]